MRRGAAGFTLLELMSVLAIMGVLVAIAIPSFGYLAASTKVKAASTELYLTMIRARSEAVKRNRGVAIVRTGTNWQEGWQVIADTNNDGDFSDVGPDPEDDRLIADQGELKRVTITGSGSSVVFRPSGRIGTPTPPAQPTFDVTSEDPDRDVELRRCVTADVTGKPYIRQEACP